MEERVILVVTEMQREAVAMLAGRWEMTREAREEQAQEVAFDTALTRIAADAEKADAAYRKRMQEEEEAEQLGWAGAALNPPAVLFC